MKFSAALSFAIFLGGCSLTSLDFELPLDFTGKGRPDTRSLTSALGPVNKPMLRQLRSMNVRDLLSGETRQMRISRAGNGIRVREPDGCVWTRSHDWFAPSDSFAHCGTSQDWHTAQARVLREGSLFPLQVGKSAAYERQAVSWNGKRSTRRTICEVEDAIEVLRPGQNATPALVVGCDDGRVLRTTWYAPGEGPIAYREVSRGRGVRDAWLRID